ncbi:hypothetical protein GEMRC1_006286 [Eukaryota sp. GEM-RC1]
MADNLRREQSTGQSLDSSSFLVLQRQLKIAIDLHKDCLDFLSVFWKQLLVDDQSQITLTNLPSIAEKFYQSKTEAESYFTKLLRQHPGNKEVLEAYSKFVREITLDDEFADSLLTQMELADSDRQSSAGDQSSVDQSVTGKSFTSARNKKRKSKRRRKGQSILLYLGSDRSSENASSAEKLRVSVHIALIILIVICIFSFVQLITDVQSISEQFSYLFEADHYGGALQDVTVQSLLCQIQFWGIISFYFTDCHQSFDCIGDVSDIPALTSQEVLKQLIVPSIFRESPSVSYPHVTQSEIVSLWELSFDYCRRAFLFGRNETERVDHVLDSHHSNVFFLVQNREEVYDGVLGFPAGLKNHVLDQLSLIVIINVVSIIASLVIVVVIGVFLFGRTLQGIIQNKIEIFNLFLYVPPDSVSEILDQEKFSGSIMTNQNLIGDHARASFQLPSIDSPRSHRSQDEAIDLEIITNFDLKSEKTIVKEQRTSNGWKFWAILCSLFLILIGIISISSLMFQLADHVHDLTERSAEISIISESVEVLLFNVLEMSKSVVAFASTGDLRYYHRYFSSYHSVEQSNAFSTLQRVHVDGIFRKFQLLSRNNGAQRLYCF